MLAILVLVLGLMVPAASMAYGGQSVTVNNQPLDSITLKVGQTCTVEVVSDDSNPYNAYVGFDDGLVLGTFSHLETKKKKAGDLADATEYDVATFYGYFIVSAGSLPPPSPGVHFVFQYTAQQLGETDLKLYDEILTSVRDSVHITVVPAEMGTGFTYQGRLIDSNSVANGLYDFEFELYDAPSDGNQLGSTIDINDLDVIDGYFTVELDYGSVYDGNGVWLEIGVRAGELTDPCEYTVLEPRQRTTPTPYAIYAQEAAYAQGATDLALPYSGTVADSGPVFSLTNTGSGYAGHFEQAGSSNTNGGLNVTTAAGLYGAKILNQGGNSGYSYGLHVTTEKDTGTGSPAYGIKSIANNNNSYAYGLAAEATSTNSYAHGGYFKANAGGSVARGIAIDVDNTKASGGYSYGIWLDSSSTNGTPYGIYSTAYAGSASTSSLHGIYSSGTHYGTAGTSYGMYSRVYGSNAGDSYGIYSYGSKYSSDTAGTAYGGYFIGDNDRTGGESYGLYTKATGLNGNRYGLYSEVMASSGGYNNYGVKTQVANNNGYSYGLYADLDPGKVGCGVYVDLNTTTASTWNQYGLYSNVNHRGTLGIVYGVQSYTHSSNAGTNYAGYFSAYSNSGDTGSLYGIYASCDNYTSGNKYAGYFYKIGKGNYAGYFYGNVHVQGSLTKSGGSFKIDHPLDPENKYLSHSFVESPDMMNVYNGNAALDENGEACVQLPEYFEALNQDFRYQLTAIGAPAPNLYIAEKISDNRFKIAGGKPGMEVSWQVTGVRHDPYAVAHRVQVEEEKNNEERGYYLNPMAYGLPEEKGIESVRNPRVSETRQVAKGDVSYETD